MKLKSIVILPFCVGSLPFSTWANHADFFVDGAFSSSTSIADVGEASGDGANILGAFRKYETINNNLTGNVSASLAAGGPLQIADLNGGMGTYWFGYGNFSDSGTDLNANFVGAAGWNALVFTVDSVAGSGMLSLTLDSGPDTFTFSDLTVSSPGSYSFLHSEALGTVPSFDFTSVDGFSFEVDSLVANSTFGLSGFTREFVIPEPSSAALLLLGLSMALGVRRRARG